MSTQKCVATINHWLQLTHQAAVMPNDYTLTDIYKIYKLQAKFLIYEPVETIMIDQHVYEALQQLENQLN